MEEATSRQATMKENTPGPRAEMVKRSSGMLKWEVSTLAIEKGRITRGVRL
jgi:hypothetical protein